MADGVVTCEDCKYSTCYYRRFDNQYVCLKNMDKWLESRAKQLPA